MSLTYRLNWINRAAESPSELPPRAGHYRWCALAVLLLTIYGCLIPLRFRTLTLGAAWERFQHLRYYDPGLLGARGDWLASAAQFAALSFLIAGAISVDRGQLARLAAASVIVLIGIGLAIGLEFLQVFFPPRTVSLNDLAVESIGVTVGGGTWLFFGQAFTDWARRFWGMKGLSGLARQALPAYLAGLVLVELMPFDLTINREELALKFHEGKVLLGPFGDIQVLVSSALVNVAAFLPLGLLVTLAARGSRPTVKTMAGLGFVVATLVELLQFFVYSRYCNLLDIATGTAAIVVGWRLGRDRETLRNWAVLFMTWRDPTRYRRALRAILFGTWFLGVALIAWQPFDFSADPVRFATADASLSDEQTSNFWLRRMTWAPLADYYWGSKYQAADHFLRELLSFTPLGVLIAMAPNRGRSMVATGWLVVLAALIAGIAIETGQYFIPDRHPSTSDLLGECLGAWLGYSAARHVMAALRTEVVMLGEFR